MALIQSGASADVLTVDPASKAARVIIFDSGGNEVNRPPTASYIVPVGVRLTAALAAASPVWQMRNTGVRTVYLRRLRLMLGFDGTATAASSSQYSIIRTSAASMAGGNIILPISKRTTYPATTVGDIRQSAGGTALTATGVTLGTDMTMLSLARSATGGAVETTIEFDMGGSENYDAMELLPGEGIAIVLRAAAVIGDSIWGNVQWDER